MWTFTLTFILATSFVHGQELKCSAPGQCVDSQTILELDLPDERTCLIKCQDTDKCNWYTYNTDRTNCILFEDCLSISEEFCPSCLSGQVDCPAYQCGLSGFCQGRLDHQEETESEQECLSACQSYDYCTWYTFDKPEKLCYIFKTCPTLDEESCDGCVSGEQGCSLEPEFNSKVLIFSGFPKNYDTSESLVLSLWGNTDEVCQNYPSYPEPMEGSVGEMMVGNTPLICGGFNVNGDRTNKCFMFGGEDVLESAFPMTRSRGYASSIPISDSQMLVAGGSDDFELSKEAILNTTEFVGVFEESKPGPDLPIPLSNFCFVKINDTTAMVIGGTTSLDISYRTFFYDIPSQEFRDGPELGYRRQGMACETFEADNGKVMVAVIGGFFKFPTAQDTVSLWDPETNLWIHEGLFPIPIGFAKAITSPDRKSIYVIGGYDQETSAVDKVYKSSFNSANQTLSWELQDLRLPQGRCSFVAMEIAETLVDCS